MISTKLEDAMSRRAQTPEHMVFTDVDQASEFLESNNDLKNVSIDYNKSFIGKVQDES